MAKELQIPEDENGNMRDIKAMIMERGKLSKNDEESASMLAGLIAH